MADDTFTWGSGGEKLSSSDRRRRIAEAMMQRGTSTAPIQHWTQGAARVAEALLGQWEASKIDAEEKAGRTEQGQRNALLMGGAGTSPAATPAMGSPSGTPAVTIGDPTEVENNFVNGVRDAGLSNPVGLAAVAAYGNAESKYSPANVNRTWSDPSESGQAGVSGGIMSWRDDRLRNLYRFAQGRGEQPGAISPATQAAFFASEDPTLIPRLNAVKSPDEANQIMAGAWRFAGHDRPGQGEYARRLALTQVYANRYGKPHVAAADAPAPGANPVEAATGASGFFVPPGQGSDAPPIMQPGGALPNFDQDTGRWTGPSNPPALATGPAAPAEAAPSAVAEAPAEAAPLAPVFTTEGLSQPWMGSAIMPPPPQPQVAEAAAPVPLPPARPADLAMPQADQPAPGAVPAVGQVAPALPAPSAFEVDPNSPDGGARAFQLASAGNAPVSNSGTIFDRIVAAVGGSRQDSAQPSPSVGVQRVAAAQAAAGAGPAGAASTAPSAAVQRVAAASDAAAGVPAASPAAPAAPQSNARLQVAYATMNSRYATPGEKAIAQAVVLQSIKGGEFETITRPDGSVYHVPKTGGSPVQVFGPQAKPEGPTGDMREYALYTDQAKAAGQQPESFTDWSRGNKAAGRTSINIDTKGAGKFTEKANEYQAKRYSDMASAADEAVVLRSDVEALSGLLSGIQTGRSTETKLSLAQMAKSVGLDTVADGLTGGKMNEMEAAQSIMDKLTPRMRVPGSGATSDMEMRTFRNALPSLLKQPGGNAIVADTYRGMLDYQAQVGDIAGRALRGEMSQSEADKAIRETPSPFARFKEYQKAQREGGGAPASPPQSGAAQPAQMPRPSSKAEFDALPSGSRFIDPNGQPRIKP